MFKKIKLNYFYIISILCLFFIVFIISFLNSLDNDKKLINSLENTIQLTKNLLNEQERYALSLSLLISEDKEFLNSFYEKNREESFLILNEKIKRLSQLQNSHFEVQVQDRNLNTYLRSWDFSKKDIPLSSFRLGLVKVKKTLKPLVSIELGKRLNIKAISPLIKNNEFLGTIEVIIGFDYLEKQLKDKGYNIYIFLENKYLNIANKLRKNPKIGNFTLVNNKFKDTNYFKNINISKLKDYGYFTNKKQAFSYFSIYSLKREKLGYIIISIKNEDELDIKNFYKNNQLDKKNRIIIE